MKNKLLYAMLFLLVSTTVFANNKLPEFSSQVSKKVKDYKESHWQEFPVITWGADLIAMHANGNTIKTKSNSLFSQQGFNFTIIKQDNFQKQVEEYMQGQRPFLRGTMGMINSASELLNKNEKTKPVVFFKYSWSAGGDALVVKHGIKKFKDLKGKKIAIQKGGPHITLLKKNLNDAGLTLKDVTIIWTDNLVGFDKNAPGGQFYEGSTDAAYVIIPDAMALTSGGKVGTGSEDSVKGATIFFSTKTANRIISDVIAVRKDYFDANRDKIKRLTKALLLAEESLKELFEAKSSTEYKTLISTASTLFDLSTNDASAMYYDAELDGYPGNQKFFEDPNELRNFARLTTEIQSSLIDLGVIKSQQTLLQASWQYQTLASGLKNVNISQAPRFNEQAVMNLMTKRAAQGNTDSLFDMLVYFKPNQSSFPLNLYREKFIEVINYAATYGGAIVTIEGHGDPMKFLRRQKDGAPIVELNTIRTSAKNLTYSRANQVRDAIIELASQELGITLDKSQFATVGHGFNQPKYAIPSNQQEWYDNMRVEFKVIEVEAESSVFTPL